MSHSELIEVAGPPFLAMAEEIRLFLQQHGIRAVLNNTNAGAMLPHLGTAIGVPVLVSAGDAVRASQLLEQRQPGSQSPAEAWYCGACQVDVEPGFETCWSCGQPRSDVEQPAPEKSPSLMSDGPPPEDVAREKAEALIRRAWRISIVCLGFLPVVGHIYSLALLLESTGHRAQLSAHCRQLFFRTLLIDVVAIGGIGTALWALFRGA